MLLWGGRIVFDKDTASGSPHTSTGSPHNGHGTPPDSPTASPHALPSLAPVLAHGQGPAQSPPLLGEGALSTAQLEYMESVVHPLLTSMAQEAVSTLPDRLAVFFAQWLLESLGVPWSITSPVYSWLKWPTERSPPAKRTRKQPQSADKLRLPRCDEKGCSKLTKLKSHDIGIQTLPTTSVEVQTDVSIAALESVEVQTDPIEEPRPFKIEEPRELRKQGSFRRRRSEREGPEAEVVVEEPREFRKQGSFRRRRSEREDPDQPLGRSASSCSRAGSAKSNRSRGEVVSFDEKVEGVGSLPLDMARTYSNRAPPAVPQAEVFALLRKAAVFKHLEDDDVHLLSRVAKVNQFEIDQDVVRTGDKHELFHVIHSGEARVTVPTVKGTLKAGESFGDHAITKCHLPSTCTISAMGGDASMVTLSVSLQDLSKLNLRSKLRGKANDSNFFARTGKQFSRHARAERRRTPAKIPQISIEYTKSEDDRKLIRRSIMANTHFTDWLSLSEAQIETMIDMMRRTTVHAEQAVITKGERGNTFYIVDEGILEVIGSESEDNSVEVGLIRIGDSFGELALLYNVPRKVTVRAKRESHLWVLDRDQFRMVMQEKSEMRIAEYARLINTVPLLAELLSREAKEALSDALEEKFYVKDDAIVTQGEHGEAFYMVFDGTCEVQVDGEVVEILTKGHFFGERALLNKEPRSATVTCTSATATLLALDSNSFSLFLGDALKKLNLQNVVTPKSGNAERSFNGRMTQFQLIEKIKDQRGRRQVANTVPLETLETVGILGYGAFGIVSLRRCKETGKEYAMKALSKGYILRERLQEHVLSEKQVMEMLDCRFTVQLVCTYRDSEYVYFLMEPALGGELFETYNQHEEFFGSVVHTKFYAVCAAHGLQHLHSRRIVYRDLKLENVLLYRDGYATLTDLGLAKVVIGKTYTVCGTADYFAPETLRQIGHNRAVDWWALGVMIFIMMAGRSPFDAEDVMQIYRNIVKGFKKESFPESFTPCLVNLIQHGLCRKKPEERLPMLTGGLQNLEQHAWFRDIPFQKVLESEWPAPWIPPEPNYAKMREKMERGRPPEVEFVPVGDDDGDDWDESFVS